MITLFLSVGQELGEQRQDTAGQRNVAGLYGNIGGGGEGFDDGEQGSRSRAQGLRR